MFTNLIKQLNSLIDLLNQLEINQYVQKIDHLSKASIGGHSRHIIELLQCTIKGYNKNEIDYFNRARNTLLEQDPKLAIAAIEQLITEIKLPDKPLKIAVNEIENNLNHRVNTTYFRELIYNEEHIIHHFALIKVALIEMNLQLINNTFGVAPSTLLYQANLLVNNEESQ